MHQHFEARQSRQTIDIFCAAFRATLVAGGGQVHWGKKQLYDTLDLQALRFHLCNTKQSQLCSKFVELHELLSESRCSFCHLLLQEV